MCVCVMRAHFAEKRHGINSIIFWFSEGRRQSLEEERTAIRLFWKTVSTSAARSRETKKKNFLCVMCVCVCVSEVEKMKAGLHCVLCSLG